MTRKEPKHRQLEKQNKKKVQNNTVEINSDQFPAIVIGI